MSAAISVQNLGKKYLLGNQPREHYVALRDVLTTPAPDIEILEHTPLGTVLTVRPYCHNDHYWQVYFDTNKAISDTAKAAGWPAPEARQVVRQA